MHITDYAAGDKQEKLLGNQLFPKNFDIRNKARYMTINIPKPNTGAIKNTNAEVDEVESTKANRTNAYKMQRGTDGSSKRKSLFSFLL